jgi:TetR/AcrR family transcriptional regulator
MDAALEVFSKNGFGGTTIDQIAENAGLSKPNILYYFSSKEEIHLSLLQGLLVKWLEPLRQLNPTADPITEITSYVQRKLEMSQEFPRESRLFAIEILQGAKHLDKYIQTDLKELVKTKATLIDSWIADGKIAKVNSTHLLFSIWATTQHYADFDAQIKLILEPKNNDTNLTASQYLKELFTKLLSP